MVVINKPFKVRDVGTFVKVQVYADDRPTAIQRARRALTAKNADVRISRTLRIPHELNLPVVILDTVGAVPQSIVEDEWIVEFQIKTQEND